MKKLFAIFAIAALASCGGSADNATDKDTATKVEETPVVETPKVDTVKTADGTKDSLYISGTDTTKVGQ